MNISKRVLHILHANHVTIEFEKHQGGWLQSHVVRVCTDFQNATVMFPNKCHKKQH